VGRDEAQQPAHAEEGGDEGGGAADGPQAEVVGHQQVAFLPGLVGAGGHQRRHGEEEGELGGRLAREAEQQAADDGGAGARGAGDQRAGLGQAELERVHRGQLIDTFDPDHVLAPFGPEDDEGADDEGRRHRHRVEQRGLDRLAEDQAEHGQRQEGDADVEHEAPRRRVAAQARQHAGRSGAVFPADGQHGGGLDHDQEQLAALVVELEQVAGEDQVAGGGDGQELGEAFDQAEDQRLEQGVEIHVGSISGRRWGRRV
jgi:hypothetical protein